MTLRPLLSLLVLLPSLLAAQVPAGEYAQRRQALGVQVGSGVILALGAPEPRHDYDDFSQGSRFHWLTGYREPGAALLVVPGAHARDMLFVQPRDPATEVWSGKRFGPDGAARLTGLVGRAAAELPAVLDSLAQAGTTIHLVSDAGDDTDNADVRWLHRTLGGRAGKLGDVGEAVDRLRGRKSDAELALIREAVAITVEAQREAMRAIEPGMNEFEIEALIEYTFRRNGADRPAFSTIVGSGPNATTLHYKTNDRYMQAGDVVVMDIGASYRGYAADVTRTVPVSGTFTAEQRAIYQVVRDAQAAAESRATPGSSARDMMVAASRTLAQGLARIELIQAPDATYDCLAPDGRQGQCPQLQLFYMHGLGHGIGLDVHDPEQFYFTGTVDVGSAFTIEPGIYVRANVLDLIPDTPRNRAFAAAVRDAVARHANIGVRIEDDYIVTANGLEWLSRAPREIDEIEALMREPWRGPAARDAQRVEWYRETEARPARP